MGMLKYNFELWNSGFNHGEFLYVGMLKNII